MWPFLGRALFPPPTKAWLQRASSDPAAQGWGAWGQAEKTPRGSARGGREPEDEGDPGFLLALLESEGLAEGPVPEQELEAIRLKLWAMEQARAPEPQAQQREEDAGAPLAGQPLSPEAGGNTATEKVEADHRSIYVGNVDYGGTAQELEAYFNHCGEIHRVTILCDRFSGHPKGSGVRTEVLDRLGLRFQVLPKRTNLPGISSTDRGGLRGHCSARGRPLPPSGLEAGPRFRPRGRNRGRGRAPPGYSPY
uniref:PABPN1 like, cytoplasmic n=1 Tax=Catagonus wagneri TaxID=51154 RepID=A0A8C3WI89_9CETA